MVHAEHIRQRLRHGRIRIGQPGVGRCERRISVDDLLEEVRKRAAVGERDRNDPRRGTAIAEGVLADIALWALVKNPAARAEAFTTGVAS